MQQSGLSSFIFKQWYVKVASHCVRVEPFTDENKQTNKDEQIETN